MSLFDSQQPQSIPNSLVMEKRDSMIDTLLELRSKMQHKRRSRVQDSLLSNTLVITDDEESLIQSHTTRSKDAANTLCCAICISTYERNDAVVWSNHCPHMFHRDCLVSWLLKDRKASCPCCRQRFIQPENNKIETTLCVPLHSLLPMR